jgi:hypothetical protein
MDDADETHGLAPDKPKTNDELIDRLNTLVERTDFLKQELRDAADQFKFMNDNIHELRNTVTWLRRRLSLVLPEPNNCTKCGAKLTKASRRCACGHQN